MRRERWRRVINDGRNIEDRTIVLHPRHGSGIAGRQIVVTFPYDLAVDLLEHNGYVRQDDDRCGR